MEYQYNHCNLNNILGREKKCPVCGKTFLAHDSHVYKLRDSNNNVVPVCSWGCVRSYENKHKGKAIAKEKQMIEKQLQGR